MHYKSVKRLLDIVFSVLLMPILGIVLIPSSIAIKIEDGGPVFYKGKRIGLNGKLFKMYKIRSMRVNAPDLRMNDESTYNAEDDPRVTKFGKIARKTSIDELPQLLNVLKGDMSFVGPRPDTEKYLHHYKEFPKDKKVLTVRPGITGYNQAVNRNNSNANEKMKNDIYYVDHFSFMFDLKILAMTVKTVLSKKNIYRD